MSPRRAPVSAAVGLAVSAVLLAGCGPEPPTRGGRHRAGVVDVGCGPGHVTDPCPAPPIDLLRGGRLPGRVRLVGPARRRTLHHVRGHLRTARHRPRTGAAGGLGQHRVPTDDAWQRIHPELLAAILADDTVLTRVTRNHILPDPLTSDELAEMEETWTLGAPAGIDRSGGALTIAGATLVEVDVGGRAASTAPRPYAGAPNAR